MIKHFLSILSSDGSEVNIDYKTEKTVLKAYDNYMPKENDIQKAYEYINTSTLTPETIIQYCEML